MDLVYHILPASGGRRVLARVTAAFSEYPRCVGVDPNLVLRGARPGSSSFESFATSIIWLGDC